VARVALERGDRLEVIAPLPFDEHRKDFVEAIDRYEFDALLVKASRITAPARELEKPPMDADEQRGLDYLHAGEHIVDASEILIAVWNGQPESGTGGTAQIIRYALETGRVVLWIHSEVPQMTPRWIRSLLPSLKATEFPRGDQLSAGYSQQAEYCANAAVDASLLAESCRALATDSVAVTPRPLRRSTHGTPGSSHWSMSTPERTCWPSSTNDGMPGP